MSTSLHFRSTESEAIAFLTSSTYQPTSVVPALIVSAIKSESTKFLSTIVKWTVWVVDNSVAFSLL